jgi:site-specific recombinase XerD
MGQGQGAKKRRPVKAPAGEPRLVTPDVVAPGGAGAGSEADLKRAEDALKDRWTVAGDTQAAQLEPGVAVLPPHTSVACGVSLFLKTLKGQSVQTHKTYRVACRIFMFFLYESGLGDPSALAVTALQPLILEDYYLWLVDRYSRTKKMTVAGYMAGPRNLFAYLARRDLTPGHVQYAKMTGGLARLVGRGGYKTPRVDFSETRKLADFMYRLKVPAAEELVSLAAQAQGGDSETVREKPDDDLRRFWQKHLFAAKRKLNPAELKERRQELLRDRALILTLYTTGMRREEVSHLNRADVRDGRLEEVLITGKGDKERVVFFDGPTLQVISEYLKARNDSYQPLFIQHRVSRGQPKAGGANFRLSPFSVWAVVQKWAGEIGVEVNPHDFRHALATTMLNNGAQLGEVQDVLGHASPVTTKMIYAHYERKTLRAAVNRHRVGVEKLAGNNPSTSGQ